MRTRLFDLHRGTRDRARTVSTVGSVGVALASALAMAMAGCGTSTPSSGASSATARPAAASGSDESLSIVRGIAGKANDLVSKVRGRRGGPQSCATMELEVRQQLNDLDARLAMLRLRGNGEHPAVMSGARMVLASARACTSCDALAVRQCSDFELELRELRRSIDE